MSELDDELEDLEPSSAISNEDGFDEPKQTTAALTMEINKLRQKNEVLRQFNVRQKDKYKHEVRSFLTPVIEKYRDVNGENEFLRTQIKELSQKISSSPLLIQQEDLPAGQEQNPVDILQKAYNEKEKEVAVLNKMVKNMEEEVHNAKKNEAEIPALRELLKQKDEQIRKAEQEKFDLNSRVEAKDKSVDKYLKQINELETNVYVLNKKFTESSTNPALFGAVGAAAGAAGVAALDHSKIAEYEEKLKKANERALQLENRVNELENQISEYQDTMDSLGEDLKEENFLNGNGHHDDDEIKIEDFSGTDEFEGELPSDEDLLSEDISLDELPLDDEVMEVEVHAPPVETKPSINFDKKAPVQEEILEDEDILGDFDLSMDSLDEDRDTTTKK